MWGLVSGGVVGSSPRTRGTLQRPPRVAHLRRFIPAHAGNTPVALAEKRTSTVHPRARGEHCQLAFGSTYTPGSSPRTRGTLRRPAGGRAEERFIPAHAGNTRSGRFAGRATAVHPRARGEHGSRRRRRRRTPGSSPRTRGTPCRPAWPQPLMRFIPAHAGNTAAAPPRPAHCAVHPRARGEHAGGNHGRAHAIGSSPRTRGTLAKLAAREEIERFIPAHAGNTDF